MANEKKAVIYEIPCVDDGGKKANVYLIYVPELKILIDKTMKIEIVEHEYMIPFTKLVPPRYNNVCWGMQIEDCQSIRTNGRAIVISLRLFKFIEKIAELEGQLLALRNVLGFFNQQQDITDIYRDRKLY